MLPGSTNNIHSIHSITPFLLFPFPNAFHRNKSDRGAPTIFLHYWTSPSRNVKLKLVMKFAIQNKFRLICKYGFAEAAECK
jgi:hypothetical protein